VSRVGGFTLIELMVTITVLMIMSGLSLSAYLKFNNGQNIQNDSRQLIAEINRVRTLSSTLQYPTGCSGLTGYRIRNTSSTKIQVTAECAVPIVYDEVTILKTSEFTQNFDVTFLPGSGYLEDTSSDVAVPIRDNSDNTLVKTITIGVYGTVFVSFLPNELVTFL